jgi:hypothetical protein
MKSDINPGLRRRADMNRPVGTRIHAAANFRPAIRYFEFYTALVSRRIIYRRSGWLCREVSMIISDWRQRFTQGYLPFQMV